MSNELVSIIIPSYNRAHLLGETLDSILRQTYKNWECIVVDDHSLDATQEALKSYSEIDVRIKYFQLPLKKKGANIARNYGLSQSQGEYIIWFDSDDLMTTDHLKKKVEAIQSSGADFIIAQTVNFKNERILKPYKYVKKPYGIKASDFILLKIHWYTYDVMLKREIADKISWNEKMKSWQDYNYFCKMLLVTENGDYLDEVLTYRRLHPESIQQHLNKNSRTFNKELLENRLLTYKDISANIDYQTRKELVFGMMNLCFKLSKLKIHSNYFQEVSKVVKEQLGLKSLLYFQIALAAGKLAKKGHFFLNKSKQR